MLLGVDYYPEQWDEALLEDDLDNIVELGCTVIRIAEFAWHLMEKREGEFDFSFFDRVIASAKRRGLRIIMGTPTATIPAWLAAKHPNILSRFENGNERTFGGRHIYCFNSAQLYDYSERILRAMLTHYKDEEAIIAWQIDNEVGHEGSDMCYCDKCKRGFRAFLSNKFGGDIEKLNNTYGTSFWSQEYNSFEEIPIPTATITTHNPSLRLDWERFRHISAYRFIAFQAELIRSIMPKSKVMHDFSGGGLEKSIDFSRIADLLDVVAYNNYPVWGGQKEPIPPNEIAFNLDYIRGLDPGNFWVTEAIMGAQGHDITGFLPRPRQAIMWSYQAMARGCEAMLYFRYRGATKGAEQFCYGVIDADNEKRRKFYEVKEFFGQIKKYEAALTCPISSPIAILYDYDSLASLRIQRQSILMSAEREMKRLHKAFYDNNIMTDIIPARRDISDYKVVVLPLLTICDQYLCRRLEKFVREGGILLMTYRTAVKDTDNNLVLGERLPLGLCSLAGVRIEETESLQEYDAFPLVGEGEFANFEGHGGIFRDMLQPCEATTLYSYGDRFYKEYSAITCNSFGNGYVYYFGTTPDEATLESVIDKIIAHADIKKQLSASGIEIVERGEGENALRFTINHNSHDIGGLEPFGVHIDKIK